jgi:HK97 family phage portal protein
MNLLARIFGRAEKRNAPSSWDLMRGAGFETQAGVSVSPYIAENLSAVFACVQAISETVASLPLLIYRKERDGVRVASPSHPVALLFSRAPNSLQTPPELIEMATAHCLLRGNSYMEIVRDNRGAPTELIPLHPDHVAVLRIPGTRRIVYDYSDPNIGGTRRLLPDEVLHLRDRSDDGVVGKSRLERARESLGTAIATESFAANTYRNGAALSGVLSHPGVLGDDAGRRLRESFVQGYTGTSKAGHVLIAEEGLKWESISVPPRDAEMLESRKFSTEQIARLFRVPPPIIGTLADTNYSSVTELGRWFLTQTITPWLTRWERLIERSLFSDEGRRSYEVEFDTDLFVRGDYLQRLQGYRIGREVGLYSANDLRRFERLNLRTDADADGFLSPANMNREQTREPKIN